MSNSTNKSIADREASKSHHMQDELRREDRLVEEDLDVDRDENREPRNRRIEREVSKRSRK